MKLKAKGTKKTTNLTGGKYYQVLEVDNISKRVKVKGNKQAMWYNLSNFVVNQPGKLDRFIISVEGKIYIDATHRRFESDIPNWRYMCKGSQRTANKLIKMVVSGDSKGLIKLFNRHNMEDFQYWIDYLEKRKLTQKGADSKYINSIIKTDRK